jgi:hypothetical protein
LDRKLGGPQSWSGCSGEEKNSQPVPGIEAARPKSKLFTCYGDNADLTILPADRGSALVFLNAVDNMG